MKLFSLTTKKKVPQIIQKTINLSYLKFIGNKNNNKIMQEFTKYNHVSYIYYILLRFFVFFLFFYILIHNKM